MDVSIIIVNYNTRELLCNCLVSVFEHTRDIEFEVIVSDNGSHDGSVEMVRDKFPEVRLIENNANLGFGAANNRALDIADGKYIFYLNSDTVLMNNAVKIFYDYWENAVDREKIGALGANLLDADLKQIYSHGVFSFWALSIKTLVKLFCSNVLLSFCYVLHVDPKIFSWGKENPSFYVGDVDYVTGADLFVLNDNFARYDEYFFLYSEESDMQLQMARAGKKRRLIDGPKIQHLEGGSVGIATSIKRKGTFSRIQFEISRVKFLRKNCVNDVMGELLLVFAKLIISFMWINPFILKNTAPNISKLWKV